MYKAAALIALAIPGALIAQQAPQIKSGATIYIEPMNGYETYLVAAFMKRRVPLTVVADKGNADYVITSTVAHEDLSGSQPAAVVNNTNAAVGIGTATGGTSASSIEMAGQQRAAAREAERRALGETSASIAVIDIRGSRIVFAYAAGKMGRNQLQETAEDCAKHLDKSIQKPSK